MITGELKSKVDRIWDTMWSGGISNPLSVIEQLTYLLFIKRLDELHTLRESKAARTGQPVEQPIFSPEQDRLRWSRFKEAAPEQMFETMRDEVFPFIKALGQNGDGEEDSTYSHHMRDALFMMPTPRVLANVVDQLDGIDMADRDTKGDLYEYMLGKIASAGQNGQFRTPRHIIKLMVDMTAPTPKDVICDPACGTAGFLIAASEYLIEHHSDAIYKDAAARRRFNEQTFHGYDFDRTMLRIGSMNMLLHGVENPDIRYRDSLAQSDEDDAEKYSLVLANPPFAGSLDYESTAKDLLQIVKTKKTELLFLGLFLRLLQIGGRAAVIVPDGVLFGSSKAHKALRKMLLEDQKLDAVVSMPSGVFKPYAGVSTAILFFTKTNSGGTDHVWFYDMRADGYSLDDKRTPQPERTDLPDILARWQDRELEADRERTDQSFLVPKAEIAENDYDLSLNRYKEIEYEAVEYDPPKVILERLAALEEDIIKGRAGLVELPLVTFPLVPFLDVFEDASRGNVKTKQAEFLESGAIPVVDQGQSFIAGYVNDRSRVCRTAPPVVVFGDHTKTFKYVDFEFAMGADGTKVLAPKVEADTKYLYYALSALRLPDAGYSRHYKFLKEKDIPLPLPEQKRIAAILDAADEFRAKRRESLAQLDTLLQSVFLDMFGDPFTNPRGWEAVQLSEAVREGTMVTYGIVQAGEECPSGVPYIRTGDLVDGEIRSEGLRRTDPEIAARFERSRVRTGEIVMSIRATVGTTARVPPELDCANLTQGTARISPGLRTDPWFLLYFIRSQGSQAWLQRQVKGATFREITLGRLRQMPVLLPPLEGQRRFARIVESAKQQEGHMKAHLTELDTLFASLQSRAFRGEL